METKDDRRATPQEDTPVEVWQGEMERQSWCMLMDMALDAEDDD